MSTRVRIASKLAICAAAFAYAAASYAGAPPDRAAIAKSPLPADSLANSPSAYLREGAHSKIRWQPWTDASFALARKLKRPVLIDIGATWCYWCRVMDQHTYSDPQVAQLIDDRYVPIRVDRDRRPDIDAYYQEAAALATAANGWPLICITDADGILLYAANHLPPRADGNRDDVHAGMIPMLTRVAESYAAHSGEIEKLARARAAMIKAVAPAPFARGTASRPTTSR